MRFVRWATATCGRKVASTVVLAVALGVAVPAVWLAWWLLSPLFNNVTVEEEFPLTANAPVPESVTRAEAESIMEIAAKMEMVSEEAMTPSMIARDAVALATGEFMDEDFLHKGTGQATVYQLGNGSQVLRLQSLSVTNGPGFHVLLLKDPAGRDKDQGYVDLGGLKGNRGNQNYGIPDGEEVSLYRSVMIYCQPFHVIFSTALLEPVTGLGA